MNVELDVIDAFVDGECVDREALRCALADPAGRDYLIDALDLRAVTSEMEPVVFALSPARSRMSWRASLGAAAALLICVTSAFFVGQRSARPVPVVPVAAPVVQRVVPAGGMMQAPAPTRIIHLDSEANWTETPGGK